MLALKKRYEKIYKIKGVVFEMNFSKDDLVIRLSALAHVMHIKANGHPVLPFFHETVTNVNKEFDEASLTEGRSGCSSKQ